MRRECSILLAVVLCCGCRSAVTRDPFAARGDSPPLAGAYLPPPESSACGPPDYSLNAATAPPDLARAKSSAAADPYAIPLPDSVAVAPQSQPAPSQVAAAPIRPENASSQVVSRKPDESSLAWETLAHSGQGRDIQFAQFGAGARDVLLVGSLHGDSSDPRLICERLAEHLAGRSESLTEVRITIVRDANPDGTEMGSATTASGVDLNRNFASDDWRKAALLNSTAQQDGLLSGSQPASEPETRALQALIERLQPDRVVLLEATSPIASIHYSASAEQRAAQLSRDSGWRLVQMAPSSSTGSLLSYAGEDRNIPTLVLNLPRGKAGQAGWVAIRETLSAALDAQSLNSNPPTTGPALDGTANPTSAPQSAGAMVPIGSDQSQPPQTETPSTPAAPAKGSSPPVSKPQQLQGPIPIQQQAIPVRPKIAVPPPPQQGSADPVTPVPLKPARGNLPYDPRLPQAPIPLPGLSGLD